ncbi:antitoxin [Amycolatopsis rhizosphaerae]|uniref:Antitoxin n=1 Tax=Amycolatopsis rhizosphaerae TaxID=2053003 RepID=A0A558CQ09_9PSEU|nr:antitoxin [Amycolatopsis rhizosphaerae]TVT50732.1 antitoxin [Amycolatopsis rhizosphaerae]
MGINFDEIKKKAQETKKKAQESLGHNAGKIEQGIDKAGGFAKSKLGKHADKIDTMTTKAKDVLHKAQGSH